MHAKAASHHLTQHAILPFPLGSREPAQCKSSARGSRCQLRQPIFPSSSPDGSPSTLSRDPQYLPITNTRYILIILWSKIERLWLLRAVLSMSIPSGIEHGADGSSTPITYRISGIPVDWDVARLGEFLRDQDTASLPVVESLAVEAAASAEWLTATVSFDAAPSKYRLPTVGKPSKLRLCGQASRTRATLDVDFLGMTTLFAPPQENHELE